jgi:hypothetical protein
LDPLSCIFRKYQNLTNRRYFPDRKTCAVGSIDILYVSEQPTWMLGKTLEPKAKSKLYPALCNRTTALSAKIQLFSI